ncbi:MAG TPA: type II toxin-antitoxin system HicA family toxin [Candidatus Thermoplasmatota archaeon]|nr:type II toxin-antitoxin system HicA family toxin [Candidatus Thermoplasmatota archaeon]
MGKLPRIKGADAVKAFGRHGWRPARQRGSHLTMVKEGERLILTVPLHRELDRGTLRRLIRDAGLTVDEFLEAL